MKFLKGLKINALITAIVYVALGVAFIVVPDIVLEYVPIVLAVAMALIGVYYIIDYFRKWNIEYRSNGLAIGILLMFAALFLFIQRDIIVAAIPVLLGFAVVVSGAIKLQNAIVLNRTKDSLWIAVLVLALISLVLGVIFIVNPFATSRTLVIVIGVGLLISGLSDLVIIILMSHHMRTMKKAGEQVLENAAAPTVVVETEVTETPNATPPQES